MDDIIVKDNFYLRNAGPKHFLQIILNKKHE